MVVWSLENHPRGTFVSVAPFFTRLCKLCTHRHTLSREIRLKERAKPRKRERERGGVILSSHSFLSVIWGCTTLLALTRSDKWPVVVVVSFFVVSQHQQQQHLLLLNWHTAHSAEAGSNVLCLSHELLPPLTTTQNSISLAPHQHWAVSAVAEPAPTGNGWSRLASAAAAHRYFATFAMVIFMFALAPTHTHSCWRI